MSHIDGIMNFKLRTPIKYSIGGEFKEATFLTLNEPVGSHSKIMRRMSAMVNSIILGMTEKRKELRPTESVTQIKKDFIDLTEDETNQTADQLADMLTAAFAYVGDIDRQEDFIDEFQKALTKSSTKPLCLLDGLEDLPFLAVHWDNMNYKDQQEVATKYAAFFGLGYLEDMKGKSE